jgi:hypothetical protein
VSLSNKKGDKSGCGEKRTPGERRRRQRREVHNHTYPKQMNIFTS